MAAPKSLSGLLAAISSADVVLVEYPGIHKAGAAKLVALDGLNAFTHDELSAEANCQSRRAVVDPRIELIWHDEWTMPDQPQRLQGVPEILRFWEQIADERGLCSAGTGATGDHQGCGRSRRDFPPPECPRRETASHSCSTTLFVWTVRQEGCAGSSCSAIASGGTVSFGSRNISTRGMRPWSSGRRRVVRHTEEAFHSAGVGEVTGDRGDRAQGVGRTGTEAISTRASKCSTTTSSGCPDSAPCRPFPGRIGWAFRRSSGRCRE